MSEHEGLTSEEREPKGGRLTEKEKALRDWLREQPNGAEWWLIVKGGFRRSYELGLADAEARAGAAEAAIDRVRKRHPRGDEEAGPLAPGLWCPSCGQERKDNGYGGCPDREALRGDQ